MTSVATSSIIHTVAVGFGVGDTLNREEQYYSLIFADLFYPWILKTSLDLIQTFYQDRICTYPSLDDFFECCAVIINSPYIQKSHGLPVGNYSDFIYEGSQGLLLDQRYGFFPHVTRSNTGTTNAIELAGNSNLEVYLISRAYHKHDMAAAQCLMPLCRIISN